MPFLALGIAAFPVAGHASHNLGPVENASAVVAATAPELSFSPVPGAKFLLLHFTAGANSTGDALQVELGYGTDRFSLSPGRSVWTRPVQGDRATLQYIDDGNHLGDVTLDRYGAGTVDIFQLAPPVTELEFKPDGLCPGPGPQWESVGCLQDTDSHERQIRQAARSVGMLLFVTSGDEGLLISSCSAGVIGPKLLLTAGHCFDEDPNEPSASFMLDFETNCTKGRPEPYEPRLFKVRKVIQTGFKDKRDVDFAIVEVDTVDGELGVPLLSLAPKPPQEFDDLFVIHHPRGAPKKVSRPPKDSGCEVLSLPEPTSDSHLGFGCDVDAGTSGAPVFDLEGKIVGVAKGAGCSRVGANVAQTTTSILEALDLPAPRDDVNVVVVLDRSGSMAAKGLDGRTKLAEAKDAAGLFVSLLRTDRTHQAGLVTFSSESEVDQPLMPVTPGSKAGLVGSPPGQGGAIGAITARGSTTIGGGLRTAQGLLPSASGSNTPAVLLLSDGLENTPPTLAEVEAELKDTQICAVGFGTEASLDGPRLTRLARDHGGLYVRAGLGLELKKFFALCFGNLFETGVGLDPFFVFPAGLERAEPIEVPVCGEESLTVVIGWEASEDFLALELTSPTGRKITGSTSGVDTARGARWTFLRLPLPFEGERDGRWLARVVRPRGDPEFPPPMPEDRYFLETIVEGGPRLRPLPMPPLYTGDRLEPRVVLRDERGFRQQALMILAVDRPLEGTGNLLVERGLGPARVIDGDRLDRRISSLLRLETSLGRELLSRTSASFLLFDEGSPNESSFESDGEWSSRLADLTRHEGNYTFSASAAFGEDCTTTRETAWTAYVEVGIDPGTTAFEFTFTGPLANGRLGYRLHFVPRDRYGNYLGPGRGEVFGIEPAPGTQLEGPLRDLGNGAYEQALAWDLEAPRSPGISLRQPGRPPVATAPFDCNRNGRDDMEELATGTARDRNGNRRPDDCEENVVGCQFTGTAVGGGSVTLTVAGLSAICIVSIPTVVGQTAVDVAAALAAAAGADACFADQALIVQASGPLLKIRGLGVSPQCVAEVMGDPGLEQVVSIPTLSDLGLTLFTVILVLLVVSRLRNGFGAAHY